MAFKKGTKIGLGGWDEDMIPQVFFVTCTIKGSHRGIAGKLPTIDPEIATAGSYRSI